MSPQFLILAMLAIVVAAMLDDDHLATMAMRRVLFLLAGFSLAVGLIGGGT